MASYRHIWQFVACGVAFVGVVLAPWATSGATMLALIAGLGCIAGLASLVFHLGDTRLDRLGLARRVARDALLVGIGAVAVIGWAGQGSGAAVIVPAMVLLASPRLVTGLRRASRAGPPDAASAALGGRRGHPAQAPVEPVDPGPARAALAAWRLATVDPRELSLEDVVLGWRCSFVALQQATSPMARVKVVELRQRYLDELGRRDPRGLQAWLDSGARAASNPSRFLCRDDARRQRRNEPGPHQRGPHQHNAHQDSQQQQSERQQSERQQSERQQGEDQHSPATAGVDPDADES